MKKIEYLRKVFAHTAGKSFENYVINQIWAKVEHLGLYPVTQQFAKRKDGYALLDLYFPQINFAIEVDELPHEGKKDIDDKRMLEIAEEFAREKIIKKEKMQMDEIFSSILYFQFERIKEGYVSKDKIIRYSYDKIKIQIDNCVKKIEEIVKQNGGHFTWEENWEEIEYKNKIEKIKKIGKLKDSDMIEFKRIQVTNDIFDLRYKNGNPFTEGYLQRATSLFFISSNKDEAVWFPHLTPNKGWKNDVSNDWNIFYEKYIKKDGKYKKTDKIKHNKKLIRYTFAQYKNVLGKTYYRFIGAFRFVKFEKQTFIYKKISNEFNIKTKR